MKQTWLEETLLDRLKQERINISCYIKKLEEFVEKTGKKYLLPCDFMKSGKFLEMP